MGTSPHAHMGLNGVEVFTNSSGSHHELRKLHTRVNLILEATRKVGTFDLGSCQIIALIPGLARQVAYIFTRISKGAMATGSTTMDVR